MQSDYYAGLEATHTSVTSATSNRHPAPSLIYRIQKMANYPAPVCPPDQVIVENLRRENEYLRRQLLAFTGHPPPLLYSPAHYPPSRNRRFQPVSPNPIVVDDPRVKMMVISRDKDGRYFRDWQLEAKMLAIRTTQTSPNKMSPAHSPLASHNQTPLSSPLRTPPTSFVRTDSNWLSPNTHRYQQETDRRTSRLHSPSFLRARVHTRRNSSKQNAVQIIQQASPKTNQAQIRYENNEADRRTTFNQVTDRNEESHIHSRQRRKIYGQHQETKRREFRQPTIEFSQGDSMLSIERQLRAARPARRLNCQIYMQ